VTAFDPSRFALNAGRTRPRYRPQVIRCVRCGAGVDVKDERAKMVVCGHCDAHLELQPGNIAQVLEGAVAQWNFPLEIGDSFRLDGIRYEVIARMAFIENRDSSDVTRQYLLYHPCRGTLWLDEYMGAYSISRTTHLMPRFEGDILKVWTGRRIETFDGTRWICNGSGRYELVHVDGALPWVARPGDKSEYVEFLAEKGDRQYEVQRVAGELEFGLGRPLSPQEVARATQKEVAKLDARRHPWVQPAFVTRATLYSLLLTALFLAINWIFLLWTWIAGKTVLSADVPAGALNGETFTPPFSVVEPGDILAIRIKVPDLDNAWLDIDGALVNADDQVIHVFSDEIFYYHGWEDGWLWSEGERDKSFYFKLPQAGTYRLLLHAVSGEGECPESDENNYDIHVRVKYGAKAPHAANAGIRLCGIMGILVLFLQGVLLFRSD